jgi:hypothetical protein
MKSWLPTADEDRVQSLKTAVLTGTAAGLVVGAVLLGRRLKSLGWSNLWQSLGQGLSGETLWLAVAIAALSGSLFGITYRYAIRQDTNLQINLGVILAFSLVRGLAMVDTAAALSLNGWPFLNAIGESLLMFTTAAGLLELALKQGWIKRVEPWVD